jgi:hypothetical protein
MKTLKRRKKAKLTKAEKVEKAWLKRLWPMLKPIFLDENGTVRRAPDGVPRRKRRTGGSGDGMPAR